MIPADCLVSIGLPVRNGAASIGATIDSVVSQSYSDIELIICDNASTDATEEICRSRAAEDARIRYVRHRTNIGLLNNFTSAVQEAEGGLFRWIGDDDRVFRDYVARTRDLFLEDRRLVLVSTRVKYVLANKSVVVDDGLQPDMLNSSDAGTRYEEFVSLLNRGPYLIDPLYSMVRRDVLTKIPRQRLLREDQIFASRLALAGPWGHVPQTLAERTTRVETRASVAELIGAPRWNAYIANSLQFWEMRRVLDKAQLTSGEIKRARRALNRMYIERELRRFSGATARAFSSIQHPRRRTARD